MITEGIGKDISDPFGARFLIYKKTLDENWKNLYKNFNWKKHSVGWMFRV